MQRLGVGGELAFQFFDLGGGLRVFLRQRVQIGLGSDGRRIRFVQRAGVLLILPGGGGDLRFKGRVLLFGLIQRVREFALPGIGVFQLLVRSFQRTLVLRDGFLLQR